MTTESKPNLLPGSELDAIMAEIVMTKVLVTYRPEEAWRTQFGVELIENQKYIHIGVGILDNVPKYSTDMAAAWEIKEKLRTTGVANSAFTLTQLPGVFGIDKPSYFVGFGKFVASSESAPHAICIAALKATGFLS